MVREAMDFVKAYDPELGNMIEAEYKRQQRNIELIASENIVSEAVMAAMGSVLTNKYAEGYPGKRYYGGCECVDEVERLAISRVCEVFGAKFANVQPHSGAQANMAVYQALCKPGDTVMGMSLDNGGHLTHGSPVNQSGLLYHIVSYGVDDNGYIDYDAVRDMAKKEQPKMSSPAPPLIRVPLILKSSLRSHTRSAPTCSSIWRISQVWSPPVCIRARFRMRTS